MVARFQPPDILSNSYWAVRLPLASCTLINLRKRLTENKSISIHQTIFKNMPKKIGALWIVIQVLLSVPALQNTAWFSLFMTNSRGCLSVQKVQDRKGKTRDYAGCLKICWFQYCSVINNVLYIKGANRVETRLNQILKSGWKISASQLSYHHPIICCYYCVMVLNRS